MLKTLLFLLLTLFNLKQKIERMRILEAKKDFDGLPEAQGLGRTGEHKVRRSVAARSATKQSAKHPTGHRLARLLYCRAACVNPVCAGEYFLEMDDLKPGLAKKILDLLLRVKISANSMLTIAETGQKRKHVF